MAAPRLAPSGCGIAAGVRIAAAVRNRRRHAILAGRRPLAAREPTMNESSPATARHSLQRFVDAQQPVYDDVRTELAVGRKQSHWMWFVFPQLKELGHSQTARHFGIDGRAEARDYWAHPVLGARLRECIDLMLAVPGDRSAHAVLGSPDDLKFCSCLTLFEAVAPEDPRFERALARFYSGRRDPLTLKLLG